MLKKIKSWIIKIFGIERCVKCNKILSHTDKKKGGCGYANGKSFSYCIGCSHSMVTDLLSGKEPKLPKIMEETFKSTQAKS